jgi:hypothetical protein
LSNDIKTKAQLTLTAVLLVHGSWPTDMNETLTKNAKPFALSLQIMALAGKINPNSR